MSKLGDGTDISGLPETHKALRAAPGKKLEGKKDFLFPSKLINTNVADGLGTMPSRDSLEIRSLL